MIGSKKAVVALADCWARRSLSDERQPRVIAALGRFKDPRRSSRCWRRSRRRRRPSGRPRSMRWSRSSRTRKPTSRDEVVRALAPLCVTDPAIDVRQPRDRRGRALGDREAIPALDRGGGDARRRDSRRRWPWRPCPISAPCKSTFAA